MSLWSIWSGSVSPSPPRIVRLYVHKHSQQSPLSELSHVIGIYLTFSVQFPTLLSTIKIVKPATNTPNVMGFVSLYSILLISIQNRIVKFTRKKRCHINSLFGSPHYDQVNFLRYFTPLIGFVCK